jgi:hypothetical protein
MALAALLAVLVWFCPLDPLYKPQLGYGGSPEYMALFTPQAPWREAAAHVGVFKLYPQWLEQATDEQLRTQFADLRRRKVAIAIEYGVLTASGGCGAGIEGFGGEKLVGVARRIASLGGTLGYVAMDEPFFWSTLYAGQNACRWTPAETAANAAVNIKALLAEFPAVRVGDVEPTGFGNLAYIERYRESIEAFKSSVGFAPAFFHVDEAWDPATFPADLVAVRRMLARERVPFGIIDDGNPRDASDAAWIASAERHLIDAERAAGTPDQVVFQSWHRFPKKLLPESDSDAFTWLIAHYFSRVGPAARTP